MTENVKKLADALTAKDKVESYLSNLEKLKVEGSVTEEQYASISKEYYERLGQATSQVVLIKNELKKEHESIQQKISAQKQQMAVIEAKHKVGELSAEQFKAAEKEQSAVIQQLEHDSREVALLIKANTAADINSSAGKSAAPVQTSPTAAGATVREPAAVQTKETEPSREAAPKAQIKERPALPAIAPSLKNLLKSRTGPVIVVCGILLLVVVFLPWIAASEKLGEEFGSASGMDISVILGAIGILCGLASIAIAFVFSQMPRGILLIIIGIIALVTLLVIVVTGSLPLLSELARSLIVIREGLYLYIIISLIIIGTGIYSRSHA